MYERFYGFRERPFDLTPNPRYLYLTAGHREALATLTYGLDSRKGITLLIGEAGTGKTTLIRAAIDGFRASEHRLIHLTNPTLTRGEFYELLASRLDLSDAAAESKADFLVEMEASILDRRARGGMTALVIDEAQSLPQPLLEEVRLLANTESNTEKLLPLVLAGQPELATRLEEPEWDALRQRVSLRCEIGPLDIRDTAAYIAGRVRIAGGDVTQIFTRDAVAAIFQHSRGVPRTISVICDNALISGFASGLKPITRGIVFEVCRELHLAAREPEAALAAPSAPHVASASRADAVPATAKEPRPEAVAARPDPVPVRQPQEAERIAPNATRAVSRPAAPGESNAAQPQPRQLAGAPRPAPPGADGRQTPSRPDRRESPVRAAVRQDAASADDRDTLFRHFDKKKRFLFF